MTAPGAPPCAPEETVARTGPANGSGMTRPKTEPKVEVPVEKTAWSPSLLADQVVLISSRSTQGVTHVARKSWISMVASTPPMLGLACRLWHRTAINILETREFVVNVPGEEIAARIWAAGDSSSQVEPGEEAGWTLIPSSRVAPPRVQECRGHIECVLDSMKRLNDEELVFFARIVSVSLDESLTRGSAADRYQALRLLFYLETDLFGVVDVAKKIPP